MSSSEHLPRTVDDLPDAVLTELAANHPRLTAEQETAVKARLFAIMADAEGWRLDPVGMTQRFCSILDTL